MIDEMRHGLAALTEDERAEADRRVLEALFGGAPGIALLRAAFRRMPVRSARWMARASIDALRFLVGAISVDEHECAVDHVARCTFREAGGPQLCEHVCRQPTQAFCRAHGFPVSLDPDPASLACRWTWGAK